MLRYCLRILLAFLFGVMAAAPVWSQSGNVAVPPPPHDDPFAPDHFEWMRTNDPSTGFIPSGIREKELAFQALMPKRDDRNLSSNFKSGGKAQTSAFVPVWQSRGPSNVGGRTRALAVDVSNYNVLAGGVTGSLYLSTNGGTTWTSKTKPEDLHSVSCIVQDARAGHTSTWYYGTGEYIDNSGNGGGATLTGNGIYKSTDGGNEWFSVASTASNTPQSQDNAFDFVFKLAVDNSNLTQSEIYAAVVGTIYRSSDGGVTWKTVLGGYASGSTYTDVAVTSTGVVYATLSDGGTASGIWRSVDGLTWTNISPATLANGYRLIAIGIAPSDENTVYFFAATPSIRPTLASLFKYTYLSGNGGGSGGQWEDRTSGLPTDLEIYYGYAQYVAVKPDDPNMVFIGGLELYRSSDGFATQSNTSVLTGGTDQHADQHAFAFMPGDPNSMFSGNDGGIYFTDADADFGVGWNSMNTGYTTSQFYSCAIDHASNSDIIIGGMQDNGTSFTDTASSEVAWQHIWGGDGCFCGIADNATYYYASYQNGELYRLRLDAGGGRTEYAKISPIGSTGYLFVAPFVLDPVNTKMMYLSAGSHLWRNTDLTEIAPYNSSNTITNWTDLSNATVNGNVITAVAAARNPAHRVYYGTRDGLLKRLEDASSVNGVPIDISTGKNLPNGYVSCIAVDPMNGDSAIAVFSNYNIQSLFFTSDAGASWMAIGGTLEADSLGGGDGPSCRWASILPVGSGRIFLVGTSVGLYSTTNLDGMNTSWTQEGASTIGNVVVDMIDTRISDGLVVIGTHGAGMFSTKFTAVPMGAPPQVSPADNAFNISTDALLTWRSVSGAVKYRVQVSTDPTFRSTDMIDIPNLTDTSYHITAIAKSVRWYWRVQASDGTGIGIGAWSSVWHFNTGPTGIATTPAALRGFELAQTIPNPVDASAMIHVTVPHATTCTIIIYDALGRAMQTAYSGALDEGEREIHIATSTLMPGAYFYRLSAEGISLIRNFSVLR